MNNRTKKLLADKLEQLAKIKLIKDIQIKELCEACELERTTFYYHFCDKYELVSWIFEQMFLSESKSSSIINSEEMIKKMFLRMEQKKEFFANALQDSSQNNLRQYMLDFYIESEEKVLKEYLKINELDEDLDYTVKNYSYGCMGLTIEWLLDKCSYTPEKLAYHQYRLMPEILKEAYKNNEKEALQEKPAPLCFL